MNGSASKQRMAKVTADVTYGARTPWEQQSEWQQDAHGYTVTLRYQRRQLTTDFWMGAALTSEPTASNVLENLLLDASGADQPFEDWASDYGYDTDSRKAEATYTAVREQTEKLRRLLGDDFEDAVSDPEAWLSEHTDRDSEFD